jgi:hypothetical protein
MTAEVASGAWPDVRCLPETFGIYRLPPNARISEALTNAPMTFIARTDEELSIVCPQDLADRVGLTTGEKDQISEGWSAIKVQGPVEFSVVGLLASLSSALAAADISIFALSTFDTDYVLVPEARVGRALSVLDQAGFAHSA